MRDALGLRVAEPFLCASLSHKPPAFEEFERQRADREGSVGIDDATLDQLCVIQCVENNTMATNLEIDPDLLDKALTIGGEKTKKATVNRALREFIARRGQKRLLDLFGKLDWDGDYDYKRERTRK